MSSPTILFVLKEIMDSLKKRTLLDIGTMESNQKNQFLLMPYRLYDVYISFDAQEFFRRESNINLNIKKTIFDYISNNLFVQ